MGVWGLVWVCEVSCGCGASCGCVRSRVGMGPHVGVWVLVCVEVWYGCRALCGCVGPRVSVWGLM